MKVEIQAPAGVHGRPHGRPLVPPRPARRAWTRRGRLQVINAEVPLAEMLSYAPVLSVDDAGPGSFHMEFAHYEEVPRPLQDKLIAQRAEAPQGGGRRGVATEGTS